MIYFDTVKLDPVNHYYLFSIKELRELKKDLTKSKVEQLEQTFKSLLTHKMESVVEKEMFPPSGSKHDYVSLATYWWEGSDGKYFRRDGFANPLGLKYDKDKFRRLSYLTYHLTLLYYLTGKNEYITCVYKHLNNWFVNKDTKMNPNLNFGQFIPGENQGRAQGIIDYSGNFTYALNLICEVNKDLKLEEKSIQDLKSWHQEFHHWLLDSSIGIDEKMTTNNHGTFYDLAVAVIEKFIDKNDYTNVLLENFITNRINTQTDDEGKLPLELARTKSLNYTIMCLRGFLDVIKTINYVNTIPKLDLAISWFRSNGLAGVLNWKFEQVVDFDEGTYLTFIKSVNYRYGSTIKVDMNENKVVNKSLLLMF